MVAEKLPAPRLGFRRAAKQAKNISPFAEHFRPSDKIAEEAVELHHAARDVVALGAQACAEHRQNSFLDGRGNFVEPKTMMLDVELSVLPMPPQLGVDR